MRFLDLDSNLYKQEMYGAMQKSFSSSRFDPEAGQQHPRNMIMSSGRRYVRQILLSLLAALCFITYLGRSRIAGSMPYQSDSPMTIFNRTLGVSIRTPNDIENNDAVRLIVNSLNAYSRSLSRSVPTNETRSSLPAPSLASTLTGRTASRSILFRQRLLPL